MIGRTYLERGAPVVVVVRCTYGRPGNGPVSIVDLRPRLHAKPLRGTPRNVLIRRADGSLVVRPFRGLRRIVR